jgi:DNA repair protein RadD
MGPTPDQVDGELRQVTAEDIIAQRRQRAKEETACKTLEELIALGAKRGYKPGWAKHRWASRETKSQTYKQNSAPPHTLADQPHF